MATRMRPNTSAPSDGSRTVTVHDHEHEDSAPEEPQAILHLRGGPRRTRRTVAWSEGTVDNEGCGRKKSKICCIYHKPKRFDESSDEDSSSDDSDDDGRARPSSHSRRHAHPHAHPEHPDPGSSQRGPDAQSSVVHELEDSPAEEDKNAYEVVPSSKKAGKRKS
ncbi:hypothetical protein PLICRDRAFT_146084 [Plicaturopsis crispa FD-325 SS-3]|uniref:Type 1 phosphatases regulator n=1 Tax=Plicaturopsis crispa FD-325 SS-3 TaxID=944288 RepID=A0A0C9T7G6_PLICR|nr:hypothetical protein PLICRDRAFT_146084 [Plicaturopsis crispa FD-325 SS-3]